MQMTQYKGLSRAQLSYDYLHTNSTTHEFLFGALAELLDNARDASATKINIYSVPDSSLRGGYMLNFLDDGQGMSADEASDIITFGKSLKKSLDSQLIGMYGNGLKSGSMRIGNDFILFTKKGPTMTCVFLSRTFHEIEHIDEIVVPMPSFDSQSRKPLIKTPKDKEKLSKGYMLNAAIELLKCLVMQMKCLMEGLLKHDVEMNLILKYSPFKTEAQFMKEFDRIEGNSGTLVITYNLKLLDSGEPELDVKTDPFDILLSNPDTGDFDSDHGLVPERRSFRAYTSILYVDPRMRVYIQGKKVRTKRLANGLYKPQMYRYSSARFRTRSENEAKRAQEESKIAENRAREAESKARNLEMKFGASINKDQRAELRRVQIHAAELQKEAQIKKQVAERKVKSLRDPKSLTFVFGINIDNRMQDGIFVYNCSRLIKMYQKVGPQADGGVFCSGVVGIVDVPYLVLEPTHNKQDFADAKEYRHLLQAMGEHMLQYWRDAGIAQQGVTKFWEGFGYVNPNWRDAPSMDPKFVRKRSMQVQVTLQCDLCLKWRILPFSSNNIGKIFPDDWVCSMNPDPAHNRCSAGEEKLNMPEGVLKKTIKSKEDKQRDLEEEIKKKQERLEKLTANTAVKGMSGQMNKSSSFKRAPTPSSNDDDDDFSDDEVRKPWKTSSSSKSSKRAQQSRNNGASDDDDNDEDWRSKAKRRRTVNKHRYIERDLSDDDDEDEEEKAVEPDDGMPVVANKSFVGESVEVRINNIWFNGVITEVSESKTKWKIKADKQKSEKWYDRTSSDVRLKRIKQTSGSISGRSTTDMKSGMQPVVEIQRTLPTGSKVTTSRVIADTVGTETRPSPDLAATSASSSRLVENIANGYRTCLRYFLPPQWVMDKDSVSGLSLDDLANFPLEDFFDHYEKGLKKLVSGFQQDAQSQRSECDATRQKLSSLRKMIARLLKSINDDCDLDEQADTDHVDELLSLCVKQALPCPESDGDASSAS